MIATRAAILILTILIAWVASLKVRQRSVFFKVLFFLLSGALLLEVSGIVTNQLGVHNIIMYNVFFLCDSLCLLYLVAFTKHVQKGLLLGAAFVMVVAMVLSATINPIDRSFLTEGILVSGGLIVVIALYTLYRIASTNQEPLLRIPQFWVFLSALIYFGCILPFLGSEQLAHEIDHKWAVVLYNIVVVSAVVRYALIAYSCILENRIARNQTWNHASS